MEKVTTKIDHLNMLNDEEIDDYYMKCLLDFDVDNSKEAGLGLVDLRMKSGHKINYEISPINDTISFILMQVII